MYTMTQNIERGTALLDRERPGWENMIDLRRLDLASTNDCVLGQVYGAEPGFHSPYSHGRAMLGIDSFTAAVLHGFSLAAPRDGESYRNLTDEWKHLVAIRRVKADYHDYELVA